MFESAINTLLTRFVSAMAPSDRNLESSSVSEIWRDSMAINARFTRIARGVERVDAKGVAGAWLVPPSVARPGHRMMYVHGGAFIAGSFETHRGFASAVAKRLGIPVFLPDYRLAPEHPYPAALDDVLEAYEYVRREGPHGPEKLERITVAGDSAGGNLTLALQHRLRDEELEMADALLLISPLLDMTNSLPSWTERAEQDPLLKPGITEHIRGNYVDETDVEAMKHPYVSPLNGEMNRIPPTLLFVGGVERLYDDSVYFGERMRKAGRDLEFYEESELFHDWPLYLPVLPAARRAQDTIERWYRRVLDGDSA